jgi:SAM-dependent methyltransferase
MSVANVTRRLSLRLACEIERLRDGLVYFAAGTLDLEALRGHIAHSWSDYNTEEAEIGSGLFKWEEVLAAEFIARGDRVLLVGSGTGRDIFALVDRGVHVTGVEPSARTATIARAAAAERHVPVSIVEGFFEDVNLTESFDVVLFSNFCLSYIPGSRRRVDALKKARARLSPGGRVIVSTLFRQRPPRGRPVRIGRLAGALTRSGWRVEDGDQFQVIRGQPPNLHYEHIFGPGEIEREAAEAGLTVVGRGGDPHYEPFVVFGEA